MTLEIVTNTTNLQVSARVNADAVLSLHHTFLAQPNLQESAAALASELALKFNLNRVTIGLLTGKHVEITATSHQAGVDQNTELFSLVTAAMDEAISQNSVIAHPNAIDNLPRASYAHSKLALHSDFHVCSIPLVHENTCIGAITVERDAQKPITNDEISTLAHTFGLLSPLIFLKNHDSRPIRSQIKRRITHWFDQQDSAYKSLKISLIAAVGIGFALLFIPVNYTIQAPARLEGSIQRALVSPNDGFLQQSYVRPGDLVKKGQLLAELSDQDLLLEKSRWQSELAQYENAYSASLARSDRVQLVINQTKMQEAQSQLDLVSQKLERTKIIAPFDGLIIKGDLKQSLGAPVQRGDVLITIAPNGEFRLISEVDERDIAQVQTTQTGVVTLVSLPDKKFQFKVTNLTPVATTKDGKNFFEIESALTGDITDSGLRPGLDGVAKISAGKKPFIWVWTHRLWDWIRLTLWSWGA